MPHEAAHSPAILHPSASIDLSHDAASIIHEAATQLPGKSTETAAAAPAPHPLLLTGRRRFVGATALCMAMFLASLDKTVVSTAATSIALDFNAFTQISWISAAYVVASSTSQALYGKFSDIFGRKQTLLFALTLFLLSSLGCGAAPTMGALIGFRALKGVGGGGVLAINLVLMVEIVPPAARDKYISAFAVSWAVSSLLGPILGGALTDWVSWRLVFYINLPIVVFTMLTIVLVIPRAPSSAPPSSSHRRAPLLAKLHRIDYAGSATMITGVVSLLLAVSWGGVEHPWSSPLILSLFATSALFIAAFIYIEARVAEEPIAPPHLFRHRTLVALFIGNFFMSAAFFGANYYLPVYYQMVRGATATQAGLSIVPMLVPAFVIALLTGQLTSRVPAWSYTVLTTGGAFIMTLALALLIMLDEQQNRALEISAMVALGVGYGLLIQATISVGQNVVAAQDMGVVTGLGAFFRFVGTAIGVAVYGAIFNAMLLASLPTGAPLPGHSKGSSGQIADIQDPQLRQSVLNAYVLAFRAQFIALCISSGIATVCYAFIRVRVGTYERARAERQAKAEKDEVVELT